VNIYLYVNSSERQAITKTLSSAIELIGSLRSETSVISPQIIIEGTNPTGFNYAYIPQFGRYYFIDSMDSIRTNLWRLNLSVDPLMSFHDQVLNLQVIVSDNTGPDAEQYMSGGVWATTVKKKTDVLNFPSGLLDSGEYILITSGGVAS
jgi:hypothetical protein